MMVELLFLHGNVKPDEGKSLELYRIKWQDIHRRILGMGGRLNVFEATIVSAMSQNANIKRLKELEQDGIQIYTTLLTQKWQNSFC